MIDTIKRPHKKCDDCGQVKDTSVAIAEGWKVVGSSRFGYVYDELARAWWCPACMKIKK